MWRFYLTILTLAHPAVCLGGQLEFDAASVKLADSSLRPKPATGGPGTSSPGHYSVRSVLIELIQSAYGVEYDQISGGPAWLRSRLPIFEIEATMPANTTKEDFQAMLRNLLAQRFHLNVHRETENFPAFDLIVAKGGPKLKKAVATDPNGVAAAPGSSGAPALPRTDPDGFPALPPGPHTGQILAKGNLRYKFQERSMAYLAGLLGFMINRSIGADVDEKRPRVADKTGLTGTFDFTLEFECRSCVAATLAGAPPPSSGETGAGTSGPGIFGALEDQLGLKAVKVQGVPVSVLVVDSVDKTPTSN